MGFALQRCEDQPSWDAFVCASPQGNVFCTTALLAALEAEPELWFVEEAGRPVLAAVVLTRAGGVLPAPYPFTLYHGVLVGSAYSNMPPHSRHAAVMRALDFLLGEFERRHELISFCLHPAFEDLRSFSWFHYHEPARGCFRIDPARMPRIRHNEAHVPHGHRSHAGPSQAAVPGEPPT